jgi:ABC-type nitrate/sulfonate/bicarbonate transport system permease component
MTLWRIASVALFCGVWELAGQLQFNYAFPTFSATLAAFFEMVADGSMGPAYLRTLEPLTIGVVLSLTIGIGTGVAMGLRRDVEWFSLPVFIVMQAAPMAALIPLLTFVYGIGLTSKVLAVMFLALPVIAMNSYKAVRNVNPSLVAMCRSFLGTRSQQITKIILPEASPMIFAGVRLGVAEGFSGVVLAELADHAHRHRRPHHLSSLGGELRPHVCRHRLDRGLRGGHRDPAPVPRDGAVPARQAEVLKRMAACQKLPPAWKPGPAAASSRCAAWARPTTATWWRWRASTSLSPRAS